MSLTRLVGMQTTYHRGSVLNRFRQVPSISQGSRPHAVHLLARPPGIQMVVFENPVMMSV